MNRPGHQSAALVAGLAYAHATHATLPETLILASAAVLTGMLPDIDQRRGWKTLDRLVPDELLGNGGPLKHRGATHWWFWPLLSWLTLHGGATGPSWALAAAYGATVGVASHLALDAIWGKPGIPLGVWWWHAGIGLRNDGAAATVVTRALPFAALWLVTARISGLPVLPVDILR